MDTVTPPQASTGSRLLWLDGARGIAAIAVMCYHYEDLLHLRPLLNSAYMAVDLFFMMSGFVLSHSYDRKLQTGKLTTGRYLLNRAIRLYPTYLVATGVGLAYYLGKIILRTDDAPPIVDLLRMLGSNLLFVPVTTATSVLHGMFPLAPSSWSLSTEVIASLFYGLVLARTPIKTVFGLSIIFGSIFFGYVIAYHSFDLGWDIANFVPGIFRTLFEFTIGVMLFRLSSYSSRKRLLKPAILLVAVTATLTLFAGSLAGVVLCVLVLFPIFLVSAEGRPVEGSLHTVFHQLGRISYPVYLLHTPVLLWLAGAYKLAMKQDPLAMNLRWLGWAMVLGTLTLSYISARWVDEPARAWLTARLRIGGPAIRPAMVQPNRS